MVLRSALHRAGHRFRKDLYVRLGTVGMHIDVAFTRRKVAVFVEGCFWHCCPLHGTEPKSNTGYWGPKLRANVERDGRVNAALEAEGWTVLRVWEHVPVEQAVELVEGRLALAAPDR